MIISLGYRVKSLIATQFRRWATERLKEYMIKGFTMDDERLKNLGGGNYWRELLEMCIRDRACHMIEYVDHLLDVLMFAELEQRVKAVDMLLKDGTIAALEQRCV